METLMPTEYDAIPGLLRLQSSAVSPSSIPETGRSCCCPLPASGKWETEILMEVLTPTEYAAILQLHGRCFFADEAVLAELKSGLLRMGKGAAEADE